MAMLKDVPHSSYDSGFSSSSSASSSDDGFPQLSPPPPCRSPSPHLLHRIIKKEPGDGHLSVVMGCSEDSSRSHGSLSPCDGACAEDNLPKTKRNKCQVCSDKTCGVYFGASVCLPCKSFFIRYTTEERTHFCCRQNNTCIVTATTRTLCKSCRYQKCISVGMIRRERPEILHPGEGQQLCRVCGDISNGIHFGVVTCEGCKKFFRRSLREHSGYTCKRLSRCAINPKTRNDCRYCRYSKCLDTGMAVEAIKMGRPKKYDHKGCSSLYVKREKLRGRYAPATASQQSQRHSRTVRQPTHYALPTSPSTPTLDQQPPLTRVIEMFGAASHHELSRFFDHHTSSAPLTGAPPPEHITPQLQHHFELEHRDNQSQPNTVSMTSSPNTHCISQERHDLEERVLSDVARQQLKASNMLTSIKHSRDAWTDDLITNVDICDADTSSDDTNRPVDFSDVEAVPLSPSDVADVFELVKREMEQPAPLVLDAIVYSSSFMGNNYNKSYERVTMLEKRLLERWRSFRAIHPELSKIPASLQMDWKSVDQKWMVLQSEVSRPDITFTECHRQILDAVMSAYNTFHSHMDENIVELPPDQIKPVEISTEGVPIEIADVIRCRLEKLTSGWIHYIQHIPGVTTMLSDEDLLCIIRPGCIQSTALQICINWYVPETHGLRMVYNVRWHPSNPHYNCQQTLLDIGKTLLTVDLDNYEKALLTATAFISEDWPGLKDVESVKKTRQNILETFCSYLNLKYGQGNRRLEEIFSYMTVIRRAGTWMYHILDNIYFHTDPPVNT